MNDTFQKRSSSCSLIALVYLISAEKNFASFLYREIVMLRKLVLNLAHSCYNDLDMFYFLVHAFKFILRALYEYRGEKDVNMR